MRPRRILPVFCAVAVVALLVTASRTVAHKPVTSTFTYNEHIMPLFQYHCGGCHAPDRIAPMSLITYKEAYPWAESIKDHLLSESMHPLHIDEAFGRYKPARQLTPRQLDMIIDWARGSTPEGDQAPIVIPEAPEASWYLGAPDLTLTMPVEQTIDADTMEKTVCYVLPTDLPQDRWLAALDLMPGNASVVHDAVVYMAPAGQWKNQEVACVPGADIPAEQILGAWTPGQIPSFAATDAAYRIPAGARLILRIHYRKNWLYEGVEAKDRSTVGLYFSKQPVDEPIRTLVFREAASQDTVRVSRALARAVSIRSIMPHMDMSGRSFQVTAVDPEGEEIRLLRVARYDPAWPSRYDFTEPVALPPGSRITLSGYYDSAENDTHRLTVWLGFTMGG